MLPEILYRAGNVCVQKVERNNKNRGKFRHLARQVSGEVFDVPERNSVLLMYEKKHGNEFMFGQISFSHPDLDLKQPGIPFDSDYYPQISFLFIHQDFQYNGYGRILLHESVKLIEKDGSDRPIRLQSAIDSVGFFEKCGFYVVGEPFDCFNSGSRLFKTLVNMEGSLHCLKFDKT